MFKSFIYVLLLVSISSCKKGATSAVPTPLPPVIENTFTNPILSSGPDPWVIQKDSFYYYTHTLGDKIKIWRTKAMSRLNTATEQVIWNRPVAGQNSNNVWAPEMHYLDGKWYTYYTAGATTDHSTQRTFVLENSSPDPLTGQWVDKGKLADPAADFFAIDATVLEYNNKRYLLWSGWASAADRAQRIYIAQMLNPWTLATGRTLISSPTMPWEMIGAPPAVNEGPEILKNPAGKVFLFFSASGCWTDDYSLGLMTLRDGGDPLNPADWTKTAFPVFIKRAESNAYGPGHNAFFKSPDGQEDWIIYHANGAPGQGCGDARNPRIQKISFNTDGTPNLGDPVKTGVSIKRPSGEK